INAHSGLIDFGLARYRESADECSNDIYCCNSVTGDFNRGRCTNGEITVYNSPISGSDYTFAGVGGTFFSCPGLTAQAGGRVLEVPGASSATNVRQWFDFVEDFCSSTGSAGGRPRNPELRADGL